MFYGQDAGSMPNLFIEGDDCFVAKCLEVCTCVLVQTVLGDVGANAMPDLDIYSYGVPREPVFGM